ncbi:MAG: hypothetical protein ACYC7D_04465 [Nitrososphaerales archaeon]
MPEGLYKIASHGIGTVIGRRTVSSNGKEYVSVWIYVPTKISEDTAFPFKVGDPCEFNLDVKKSQLVITPLPLEKSEKLGWAKRVRSKKK